MSETAPPHPNSTHATPSGRAFSAFRVAAPAIAGVLALALLSAALVVSLGRQHRRAEAEVRRVQAAAAGLAGAQARLFAVESDLRELRYAPRPAPGAAAPATARIPRNLAALREDLARYASSSRPADGEGPEVLASERVALEQARGGVAALDALAAGIAAGQPAPEGTVGLATAAVSAPLARLSDLSRYRLDDLQQSRDQAVESAVGRALAWIALATAAAAVLALLGARGAGRPLPAPAAHAGADDGAEARRLRASLRERDARLASVKAALAEARRASESKTRFVNHVSHEFRTPLSSIIGFSSLLDAEHARLSDARRGEYVEIVLRNARHLLHVVNDLLNLSKVEAGTLEVTLAPVYLPGVVHAAVASLHPRAEERGVPVSVTGEARRFAVADTGRLRQVVLNLLENAIKYSPPGAPVEVHVSSVPGVVRVEVRDRGPGIARADQARLFKEFSRIALPGTARVAGAGLGLALSKRLVELMGGSIGVDSRPGQGSVFWVELPAGEAIPDDAEDVEGAGSAGGGRGERVAVADDDPDIRALAAAVLSRAGYDPVLDDGSPGIAERLGAAPPDLLLLDLNLAGRGGADALAEVRAHPDLASLPVVAFTADAEAAERGWAAEAGFRGVLVKPVEPGALVRLVEAVLAFSPPSPAASPPPVPRPVEAPAFVPDEGADDDYMAPLRARFRQGLPGRLEALEATRRASDAAGLAREAHKLRGAAAGYGMDGLSELAGRVEDALRAPGGSPAHPAVDALLEHLRREAGGARSA